MPDVGRVSGVTEQTYVWRAQRGHRIAAGAIMVLLLLLCVQVLINYGYLAIIGAALIVALVARTWWVLLRPKLTAGPDGVQVIHRRTPAHLDWTEIRRCEPTPSGLKITVRNGLEVVARYPQQPAGPATELTEADATAAYLAQRAAWARRPTGPLPVYVPPPRPARAVRA
jgi:hypothetical protein